RVISAMLPACSSAMLTWLPSIVTGPGRPANRAIAEFRISPPVKASACDSSFVSFISPPAQVWRNVSGGRGHRDGGSGQGTHEGYTNPQICPREGILSRGDQLPARQRTRWMGALRAAPASGRRLPDSTPRFPPHAVPAPVPLGCSPGCPLESAPRAEECDGLHSADHASRARARSRE